VGTGSLLGTDHWKSDEEKTKKKFMQGKIPRKKNSCKEEGKEVQRVSPAKKIPAQAKSEKKKFVQAEISPPHHFSEWSVL